MDPEGLDPLGAPFEEQGSARADLLAPHFPEGAGVGIGSASEQAAPGSRSGPPHRPPGYLPAFTGSALETGRPDLESSGGISTVPGAELFGSSSEPELFTPPQQIAAESVTDSFSTRSVDDLVHVPSHLDENPFDPVPAPQLRQQTFRKQPPPGPGSVDCAEEACEGRPVRARDFRVYLEQNHASWPALPRPRT